MLVSILLLGACTLAETMQPESSRLDDIAQLLQLHRQVLQRQEKAATAEVLQILKLRKNLNERRLKFLRSLAPNAGGADQASEDSAPEKDEEKKKQEGDSDSNTQEGLSPYILYPVIGVSTLLVLTGCYCALYYCCHRGEKIKEDTFDEPAEVWLNSQAMSKKSVEN
eukprot:TRINITY_DN91575_c0_g1_i1.p1 TRINITY_DN91575_c0_g1~~TRINITY_DN91575_c0_g1_i1.p1  ORF type:complete len:167 (+),score=30.82 TRINITY_DN91575_c0_g1_i1:45-545(+)